jgi:hypothetical protein
MEVNHSYLYSEGDKPLLDFKIDENLNAYITIHDKEQWMPIDLDNPDKQLLEPIANVDRFLKLALETIGDTRKELSIHGMPFYKQVDEIAKFMPEWYTLNGEEPVIRRGEKFETYSPDDAQYDLSKNVCVTIIRGKNDNVPVEPIDINVVKQIFVQHRGPTISAYRSVPYFNKNWQLVSKDGYDSTTEVYYIDEVFEVEKVTLEDAKEQLRYMTQGICFYDREKDYANYLAYLLTPLIQPALKVKMSPFTLFRTNTPGTGATTAADMLGLIYYNRKLESCELSATTSNKEVKKIITASLIDGLPQINFDNFTGALAHVAITKYMTSGVWTDRKLGESKMLSFDNPAMMLLGTSNNGFVSGDMPRRTSMIELYTDEAQPEKMKRTPENIEAYIRENRSKIFGALVTLVENWVTSGCVLGEDRIGDFKEWSKTMDGILRDAGINGFQMNRDRFCVMDQTNDEIATWLRLLFRHFGQDNGQTTLTMASKPFTAGELIDALTIQRTDEGAAPNELMDAIPSGIAEAVTSLLQKSKNKGILTQLLKNQHYLDRNYGGYVLTAEKDAHLNANVFRVLNKTKK